MKLIPITMVVIGIVALAGCSLDDSESSDVGAGSLADRGKLESVELTVGGKEFTEQLVLCEISAQALESAGASVGRNCGMSGTNSVRSALESGDIDLYWEYTGTGWLSHLGESKTIADPTELFQRLNEKDAAKNGITWLKPSPANNIYSVAVASETAEELGISTMSEYAALANSDPGEASFCGAAEFLSRDDGWPGVEEAYGFKLPDSNVSELAYGALYNSVDKGSPCKFGEVFSTDGRIPALGLTVLQDDKQFFGVYNPAVSIRTQTLEKYPEIEKVLAPVAQRLDDATLQKLNAQVDVDGKTPEQVSKDWLTQQGFVS